PHQLAPLDVSERRAVELVAARLGYAVHQATREAALPDIEGRRQDLELLEGLERDRLRARGPAGRSAGREPEDVVVHPAIDEDGVEAVVLTGDRRAADDLGTGAEQVGEVPSQKREPLDGRVGHDLRRTGAAAVDQRIGDSDHGELLERHHLLLELEVLDEDLSYL